MPSLFGRSAPRHELTDFVVGQPVCIARRLTRAGLSKGAPYRVLGFVSYDGRELVRIGDVSGEQVVRPRDLCFPGEI